MSAITFKIVTSRCFGIIITSCGVMIDDHRGVMWCYVSITLSRGQVISPIPWFLHPSPFFVFHFLKNEGSPFLNCLADLNCHTQVICTCWFVYWYLLTNDDMGEWSTHCHLCQIISILTSTLVFTMIDWEIDTRVQIKAYCSYKLLCTCTWTPLPQKAWSTCHTARLRCSWQIYSSLCLSRLRSSWIVIIQTYLSQFWYLFWNAKYIVDFHCRGWIEFWNELSIQ